MRGITALLGNRHWVLPLLLVGLAIAAHVGGESARVLLRYARPAIGEGEVWRLVTGHYVHLGFSHLAMNLLALIAIWILVGSQLRTTEWLLVMLITLAGIDAGFWWFDPQLIWYVGMSGLLHGLLVAGLLAGWRTRPLEGMLLGGLLILKLAYEQFFGALPGSAEATGGAVVVNSHLYGTLAGMLGVAVVRIRVFMKPSI